MSFRKVVTALTAATIIIAPTASQAAPVERATATSTEQSELAGPALYALIAVVVLALYFVIDGGKSNSVSS